jgi:hypothetical protein
MIGLLYRLIRRLLRWRPRPGHGFIGIRTRYCRHSYLHHTREPGSPWTPASETNGAGGVPGEMPDGEARERSAGSTGEEAEEVAAEDLTDGVVVIAAAN